MADEIANCRAEKGLACQVTRQPRLHETKSFEGFQPSAFILISNNYYTFFRNKMAERRKALNSRALDTLLRKDDRVSLISDGFGDFCFWQEPFRCLNCAPPA
jgi:hypothetical protein